MIWYDFRSSGYIVRWSETKVQNRILDLKRERDKEKRKTKMDENVFSRTLLLFCFVFLCFCTRQVFYRATLFSLLLTRSSHFISVDGYLLLLFSTILCLFRYFKLIFHICDPIFASFYIKNLLSSISKIYISEIVERENRFEGYNLI